MSQIKSQYALEKNFVKGSIIDSCAITEVKVIRFQSSLDEMTKRNEKFEYYDFKIKIKDPKFDAFMRFANEPKKTKEEKNKLANDLQKVYGVGYQIAQKMSGFEIGKEFGVSGIGLKEPIPLTKYKFLGANIEQTKIEKLDEESFKKNESKIKSITRQSFLLLKNLENEDQGEGWPVLAEEFVKAIDSKNKFMNEKIKVNFLSKLAEPFFDKISEFYFQKINESQETSKLIKDNIEALKKSQDNIEDLNLINTRAADFRNSIQRLSVFNDNLIDSLMVLMHYMIEIVKTFEEDFFHYQMHVLAMQLIRKTLENYFNDSFLDFWGLNIREIEIIGAFLKFLDYFWESTGLKVDEEDDILKKGLTDYFIKEIFCDLFKKWMKTCWSEQIRVKCANIVENAFENREKLENSIVLYSSVFKKCIFPWLMIEIKSNLTERNCLNKWQKIIEKFLNNKKMKNDISENLRNAISLKRKIMNLEDLICLLLSYVQNLSVIDVQFLICFIVIPQINKCMFQLKIHNNKPKLKNNEGLKDFLEVFRRLLVFLPIELQTHLVQTYFGNVQSQFFIENDQFENTGLINE